jgi:hypothetical protein
VADQNTINRIGGMLKNVYSDAIVEQQNLAGGGTQVVHES